MSALLRRWAHDVLRYEPEDAPPPRFANRCVAMAYASFEENLIRRLRQGFPIASSYHERRARFVGALHTIDAAWSEPDGFVYLMTPRREDDYHTLGHGKIGFSADSAARLRQLQTGCYVELIVHFEAPGTSAVERALHDHLKAHRAHGEWFRLHNEVDEAMLCLVMVGAEWAALRYGAPR